MQQWHEWLEKIRLWAARVSEKTTSFGVTLFWLCAACALTLIGNPILGAMVFVVGICVLLLISDDVLSTTAPFLMLCIFVLPCYNSYQLFIGYWWMAIPVVSSVILHFLLYPGSLLSQGKRFGGTFWGIVAVAVAISFAGVGSGAEHSPVVWYYTVFLGVGMVIAYLLLRSALNRKRCYDIWDRFRWIMLAMGIYACFLLGKLWIQHLWFPDTEGLRHFQPGNNLATFLMFALPFPLYGVCKTTGWQRAASMGLFLLFTTGLLFSTSRSGLVLAPVFLILIFVLLAITDDERRKQWIFVTIAAVVAGGALLGGLWVTNALQETATSPGVFVESRLRFLRAAFLDFKENWCFGVGLAGSRNTSEYVPVAGAMRWYHMMIPQVIGSMGLVGILAYGYQAWTRIRTYLSRISLKTTVLMLSYLGILLMSQLNPGEFCPLPYELLTVMLFVLMETEQNPQGGEES